MSDWGDLVRLGCSGAMLSLTALGLVIAALMPAEDRWNRRFFMALFATLLLCMVVVLIELLVYKDPTMATVERISVFFEYLLLPLPMPMFTAYLLHTCGEGWRRSGLFRAVLLACGVFFLLLLSAQFTTFLYYVTPDNQFCRGPWHPLLMAFMVMPMLLNLLGVVQLRGKLPPKYHAAFLVYLLPLAAALIIHTFFYVPEFIFTGMVLSTLSMFAIILYDQIDQYVKGQREIAHQRASIMVLEMRPHFIYNAMMSIYYLCARDPQKAQQVTLDFTAYLRRNFTAIASENTVPFSDELEHTRAYLAVEQVQFEDSLLVDYDTPHKEFRLPPLTLQPIVENAVKHGMDPECAPLRISIRTRRTDSGSEIVVEDDGQGWPSADAGAGRAGFATQNEAEPVPKGPAALHAPNGCEPHIALANIRQRLSMMCGGKLTIEPREGGGAVVRVTIP